MLVCDVPWCICDLDSSAAYWTLVCWASWRLMASSYNRSCTFRSLTIYSLLLLILGAKVVSTWPSSVAPLVMRSISATSGESHIFLTPFSIHSFEISYSRSWTGPDRLFYKIYSDLAHNCGWWISRPSWRLSSSSHMLIFIALSSSCFFWSSRNSFKLRRYPGHE